MYSLIIRPRAERRFARFPKKLQENVAKKLQKLHVNPFSTRLDIKKLAGTQKSFRLRVGETRIIYELDTKLKTVFVSDIDFRRTTTY